MCFGHLHEKSVWGPKNADFWKLYRYRLKHTMQIYENGDVMHLHIMLFSP